MTKCKIYILFPDTDSQILKACFELYMSRPTIVTEKDEFISYCFTKIWLAGGMKTKAYSGGHSCNWS